MMLYLMLLYASLASPDWATREYAERELLRRVDACPWLYGESLERWAKDATSPEVSARVLRPCRIYRSWRANRYIPPTPVWPVCDCYPVAVSFGLDIRDRNAVPPAPCQAFSGPNNCGPYWHRWRKGTEDMARDMIRRGVPAEQVDSLLKRMMALEIQSGSDCNAGPVVASWASRPWAGGYPGQP